MKKVFVLTIALLAIGLTVVAAQTQAQQRELEQIAMRSMNGLSTQDRQRVVQIMTDVFVAQGIPRQQAVTLAEMNADSMFMTDVGEMSPEERRQFEAEEQRIAEQRQRDLADVARLQQQQQQPGQNAGWPAAQLRERDLPSLRQPAGTTAYYDGGANWVERIYLTGANSNTLQDLRQQVATMTGQQITVSGNRFEAVYRSGGSGRMTYSSSIIVELQGNQITISFRESGA